jgi:hypothetical protein
MSYLRYLCLLLMLMSFNYECSLILILYVVIHFRDSTCGTFETMQIYASFFYGLFISLLLLETKVSNKQG